MPGSLKTRRTRLLVVPFAGLLLTVVLASLRCSGPEATVKQPDPNASLTEFLSRYEATFRPSDYDASVNVIKAEEQKQREALQAASVVTTSVPETTAGYRVQVMFTQDIDQANEIRDTLSLEVPEEWVYVVYDAPYYKVRLGNFLERPAANQLLHRVVGLGFKDAWIVPDNVIKNAPPKPPDNEIVPDRGPGPPE